MLRTDSEGRGKQRLSRLAVYLSLEIFTYETMFYALNLTGIGSD